MANSEYIYAGTSSYALQQKLLSETQRELLLGTHSHQEFLEALQGTFFGTYLTSAKGDVEKALRNVLTDAKKALIALSPEPDLLDIMWHKYDFYNLRVMLKRGEDGNGTDNGDILFPMGTYSLETLSKVVQTGSFSSLNSHLAAAVKDAKKNTKVSMSAVMDRHYLLYAVQKADEVGNPFLSKYIALLVDLYNLRSRLRAAAGSEDGVATGVEHVSGGTIPPHNLDRTDDILARLSKFGGDALWKDAIEAYKDRGDFTLIDKTADDYTMKWLKGQTVDLHSPAPLFGYLANVKENVQFIRAVGIAKYVGLSEKLLRDMVRKSFTEYVY